MLKGRPTPASKVGCTVEICRVKEGHDDIISKFNHVMADTMASDGGFLTFFEHFPE